MWEHVSEHYATFDRIAAYEILSEPRDKAINSSAVRDFYEGGCAAVAKADPRTPCMVGNAPYYKLYTFGEEERMLFKPPPSCRCRRTTHRLCLVALRRFCVSQRMLSTPLITSTRTRSSLAVERFISLPLIYLLTHPPLLHPPPLLCSEALWSQLLPKPILRIAGDTINMNTIVLHNNWSLSHCSLLWRSGRFYRAYRAHGEVAINCSTRRGTTPRRSK